MTIAVGDTLPSFSYRLRRNLGAEETKDIVESTGNLVEEVWVDKSSTDIVPNRTIVIVGLPGAYTPTCSRSQCPEYNGNLATLNALGVDDVYIHSVNDAFVMKSWMWQYGWHENLEAIPDGNGTFASALGVLVNKNDVHFGPRCWRYTMVVENGVVIYFAPETNMRDNADDDLYVASRVAPLITFLQNRTP